LSEGSSNNTFASHVKSSNKQSFFENQMFQDFLMHELKV